MVRSRRRGTSSISESHVCNDCGQQFSSSYNLEQHRKDYTSGRAPLTCDHYGCSDLVFCNDQDLQLHMDVSHPATRSFATTCDRCNQRFTSQSGLSLHLAADCYWNRVVPEDDEVDWGIAESSQAARLRSSWGSSTQLLYQPSRAHTPTQENFSLNCNGCQRTFRDFNGLLSHRDGAPNTTSRFTCNTEACNFASCSSSGLRNHQRTTGHGYESSAEPPQPSQPPTIQDPFFLFYTQCEQCEHHIRNEELEQHVANVHPPVQCWGCSRSYKDEDDLEKHHKHGIALEKETRFICPCGDTFPSRFAALTHILEDQQQLEHIGFCYHCEVTFEHIDDYTCHQERMHDTTYPENFLVDDPVQVEDQPIEPVIVPCICEGKVALTCIICLEFPEKLTATGCGHLYCNECIVSCLRAKGECPACRKRTTISELREIFV